MADNDRARLRIIASVFDKRNAAADVLESYVAHLKIWEDAPDGQGKKPRYILISRTTDNSGFIHKSKLNTNGSFSVGKTWRLAELKAIQVVNSIAFNITLARTYKWQTENALDQTAFINALVELFRSLVNTPLNLVGVDSSSILPEERAHKTAPQPAAFQLEGDPGRPSDDPSLSFIPPLAFSNRPLVPSDMAPTPQPLFKAPRPASPSDSTKNYSVRESVVSSTSGLHPPSPSIPSSLPGPPSALRPRIARHPSNATSPPSAAGASSAVPSSLVPARAHPTSSRPSFPTHTPAKPSLDLPRGTLSSVHPAELVRAELPLSTSKPPPARTMTQKPPDMRREHNNRVSFFDPANQAALDRLLAGDWGSEEDAEGAEATTEATMISVEEMLEGYEWASDDVFGRKSAKGAADLVEARLLDELLALEKANIHSFLESDDRVSLVVKHLDEALGEVDAMDSLISSYKIYLNAVGDDISYIQSQRRGLQVQMQNQAVLLSELENLLKTVQVDPEALVTLTQESLENGIQRLEEAATELYKALQASKDREMAATMERLDEYRTYNAQFCKRVFDYLSIMIVAQSKLVLDENGGITRPKGRGRPIISNHQSMESYLGRYAGLLLYLKEMDETLYSKFCAAYFSAASDLHNTQMKSVFSIYSGMLKKAPEEDTEQSKTLRQLLAITLTLPFQVLHRIKPARKEALFVVQVLSYVAKLKHGTENENEDKVAKNMARLKLALGYILEQIAPHIYREGDFIADFLQINDAGLTFADYVGLDNYFRRQAARSAGLSQSTTKLVRGAMDLIFGFLPTELKQWIDLAVARDALQVVGVIGCLERFLADADERGNAFFLHTLDKQHMRLKGAFDRHINQQIKMIDETKLTSRKRKGVAHFIKYFPVYVGRVEQQLIGADGLDIRVDVDSAYEKIVHSMFECLKHMATLDGEGEDKGQLNYHVLIVENMHYFATEMSQLETGSVSGFLKQAEGIYNENLAAYVRIVLRRPFAKLIEFFEGLERLLKTTAPSEVPKNSNYTKSALKKVLKEFDGKDVRKHIEVLFRRVEKHFTEAEKTTREESSGIAAGTVMVGVWEACEEELQRMTESFNERLSECYGDSGISMEYTVGDVEAAFKRRRLGS